MLLKAPEPDITTGKVFKTIRHGIFSEAPEVEDPNMSSKTCPFCHRFDFEHPSAMRKHFRNIHLNASKRGTTT
jgi:hypothetical protein